MTQYPRSKWLLIPVLFLISSQAWCWGDLGHSIVGAVAEERMKPETKAFVEGVLGIEPMAFTATWADAVRSDERFNHDASNYDQSIKDKDNNNFSDYHFADVPTGYTYDNKPVKDLKDAFGGISGAITVLKAPSKHFPRAAKIIALRYLIHLIGDIHQPLHVGNGYDIGANFCSVFLGASKFPTNLHSVWDGPMVQELGKTLVDPKDPQSKPALYYDNYIAAFKKYRASKFNQAKPQDVSLTAIKGWIDESAAIRETTVYPDDPQTMVGVPNTEKYKHRAYCMWLADKKKNIFGDTSARSKADIPVAAMPKIDAAYISKNMPVVEDQLINAGVRLAAVLDDIAASVAQSEHPPRTVPASLEEKILNSMQSLFHNNETANP